MAIPVAKKTIPQMPAMAKKPDMATRAAKAVANKPAMATPAAPLCTRTSSVIVQPQVIKDENDIKDEFYDSFSVRCSPCLEPTPPKRPRFRAPCEFCLSVYPGEWFPFRLCTFCGVNPSWHHGRCCPPGARGLRRGSPACVQHYLSISVHKKYMMANVRSCECVCYYHYYYDLAY